MQNPCSPYRIVGRFFAGLLVLSLSTLFLPTEKAVSALPEEASIEVRAVPPPANPMDVKTRLAELRREYEPYFRSLPKPLKMRAHTPLAPQWRMKYELTEAKDGVRPEPPAWFADDFDASTWEQTTVPEWRYTGEKGTSRVPVSCILWYRTQFNVEPAKPGQRTSLVFEGVEWEAQVWLNGKPLGSHKGYYEPFHFDVTGLLKDANTLAVRVIAGPKFGEPRAYWAMFPVVPAQDQRYVRDKAQSIRGFTHGDLHIGGGYGIHREVYLETVGAACVTEVFARGKPEEQKATIAIETDAAAARHATLNVEVMPENFKGKAFRTSVSCEVPQGPGKQTVVVPMPDGKFWTPVTPNLYRCRVSLICGAAVSAAKRSAGETPAPQWADAKDVLFGYRSFTMVSKQHPRAGLPEGMFLLNGRPLYLRGTNIQGLNALWYWSERDRLIDTVLMLKAGNFNAVRVCQHVCFPEVRELLDRLGMMSEQDQGSGGTPVYPEQLSQLPGTGTVLARACYNNPGVVLLSFGNETYFDPRKTIEAVLAVDPERMICAHQRLRTSEADRADCAGPRSSRGSLGQRGS